MKELLDGWGMRTDKRDFEHPGENGDRQQRLVAVKKAGGGVEEGGTIGLLFLLHNQGFDQYNVRQ